MLSSVFQDSKSALAFAGSVIVCALLLVGPDDKGGVLDQAVETYVDERASIASNAAATSQQMSQPIIGDYKPSASSGLELSGDAMPSAPKPQRVMRVDDVTFEPIGELPPPPPGDAPETYAPPVAAAPLSPQTMPAGPREAVVTARTIRIQPQ